MEKELGLDGKGECAPLAMYCGCCAVPAPDRALAARRAAWRGGWSEPRGCVLRGSVVVSPLVTDRLLC